MSDDPDLEAAYNLETPDDNRRLYARWATTYEETFAEAQAYILHRQVANAFAEAGGTGPVLDVGAGTGLCAVELARLGITTIDALDLSPEMLEEADKKGVYKNLFAADLLAGVPLPDATYPGIVSSGTFTHGHVGPEALDEVLRPLAPAGLAVLSINRAHYTAMGFEAKISQLEPQLSAKTLEEVRIYQDDATGDHADDMAILALLTKAS